jgi:hypothetical protein
MILSRCNQSITQLNNLGQPICVSVLLTMQPTWKRTPGHDAPGENVSLRKVEVDITALRKRIQAERTRTNVQGNRILRDMEANLLAAKERSYAEKRSKLEMDDFLRRARREVSSARACVPAFLHANLQCPTRMAPSACPTWSPSCPHRSFEADIKRHEAVFRT